MSEQAPQRRLAAILAADVVGYSRMMQADEAGTLGALKSRRTEILQPLVSKHHGRIVKVMGDGVLVEFASAVEAVSCAAALQAAMKVANADLREDRRIALRIGINLGDVMVEGGDLYGDGINVAARLEAIAEPGAVVVSRTVFDHVRGKVQFGFDDLGEQQLKNIAEPVRTYQLRPDGEAFAAPSAQALVEKPSIAVLPFTNMSGDPEQEYFSDGITEDIITELSRFRSLFVIARHSSFQFRGKAIDVKRMGRELGVQYVVEGSIRRAGDRVRVTAQLIDATTGNHVWADRYDRELKEIFAVQEEVTRTIAATAAGRVESAGIKLAERKSTNDLAAYDLVLRAHATLDRAIADSDLFTKGTLSSGRRLLEKAIQIDPNYARIYVELARSHMYEWFDSGHPKSLGKFLTSAQMAARLDPDDSSSLRLLGMANMFHRRYEDARFHFERALSINPNDRMAVINWAVYLDFIGEPSESLAWSKKAALLDRHYLYGEVLGRALYALERYEEALIEFRSLEEHYFGRQVCLAATYARLNRLDEARVEAAACSGRVRAIRAEWETYKHQVDRDRWFDAMRKAGIPV
jgi:TolB-like protein/class 3 adenylate cyclase/Tfp pilus assembly protein PilF